MSRSSLPSFPLLLPIWSPMGAAFTFSLLTWLKVFYYSRQL